MSENRRLFVTAGHVHPGPLAQRAAYRACRLAAGGSLRRVRGLRHLSEPDASGVSLCILYFHHRRDEPEVVRALSTYVHAGGALLALHGASASFKGNAEYESLLGGVFVSHGRVCEFALDCDTSLTSRESGGDNGERGTAGDGLARVVDEPYRHRVSGDVNIVCRWSLPRPSSGRRNFGAAEAPAAEEPLSGEAAWTRHYGDGRVAYCALGHRRGTWAHGHVRELLERLVRWCLEESS